MPLTAKVWRLLDSGEGAPGLNMALDEAILRAVIEKRVPPTLRFYSWKSFSVSLGYFQRVEEIDTEFCVKAGIPLVRRPTGGRAILHGDELTYSFSCTYEDFFGPKGLYEIYNAISECFVNALRRQGLPVSVERRKRVRYGHNPLCFMSSSFGEITLSGVKVLGSAQKRLREGFLQQGSMPYSINNDLIKKVFRRSDSSLSGLRDICRERGFDEPDPEETKSFIIEEFEKRFNIRFIKDEPTQYELDLASSRLEFYEISPKSEVRSQKSEF
jgi:lipoate-protein ligase A